MVARGGIEPPTRGFSVAGTAALAARKPKTGKTFAAGVGPGRVRPNPYRPATTLPRPVAADTQVLQRVARAATEP